MAIDAAHRLSRIRQVIVWVLVVAMALLAATGIYLFFWYRPAGAQVGWLTEPVRTVHRWISMATVLVAAVLAVVSVAEAAERWSGPRRRRSGAVTGPAVVVLVIAAAFTGTLLPWDQLAMWAVTVGTDVSGYRPILHDDQVRFVIVGGAEASTATVRLWLIIHALAIPAVVGAVLAFHGRNRQDVVIAATAGSAHTDARAPAPDHRPRHL